jgi:hypothetical protein
MDLVVFLLVAYGIANIMVFSSIFRWWRELWIRYSPNFFGELFTCMICLPFWIGVFLSIVGVSISENYIDVPNIISWLLDGALASGGVWLIHTIQEKLEK